jgi:hypothetical protein
MITDAADGACDQQILISNGSDYAPVLAMLKDRHPSIIRGLISPILEGHTNRHASTDVLQLADWCHYPIKQKNLEACQLSHKVPTRKKRLSGHHTGDRFPKFFSEANFFQQTLRSLTGYTTVHASSGIE